MNEFSTTDFYGFDVPTSVVNRGYHSNFEFKYVPAERMERILKKMEFKNDRGYRTKKLWENFCRSEQSVTTIVDDTKSISSKLIHPILKSNQSNETIRTLSVTEIDSLISKANEYQKKISNEVDLIKKQINESKIDELLENHSTSREMTPENQVKERDSNLNVGPLSDRSEHSSKSKDLSEIHFSHRSRDQGDTDEFHVYNLVIEKSNTSICGSRSTQSTSRSEPTPRRVKTKPKPKKPNRPMTTPLKYNLLLAKEHLEMQRILGIDALLDRESRTVKNQKVLSKIENDLNIGHFVNQSGNITSRTSRGSSPIDFGSTATVSTPPIDSSPTATVSPPPIEDEIDFSPTASVSPRIEHIVSRRIVDLPSAMMKTGSFKKNPEPSPRAVNPPAEPFTEIERKQEAVTGRRSPKRRQKKKSPTRSVSPKKSGRPSVRSFSPESRRFTARSTEAVPELTKSVCDLVESMKNEKQGLLSRITDYQEKICDILVKLHLTLDDTIQPDTQRDIERARKEKYVIEFTARFARNFLYPLDVAIKEVEDIDKTEFLNILSNDPATKVCALFGLLHQATNTYSKQFKHLLLDNCPRRLDILVKYISKAIQTCITKRIFHKDDVLIVRLQEKTKALSIKLNELKKQRKAELELCIKPKDPEKAKRKQKSRLAPMTLDMYNSRIAEKKVKSVRSKPSLSSPKKPVAEKNVSSARSKPALISPKKKIESPKGRKKRTATKKNDFKAVREPPVADAPISTRSEEVITKIEQIQVESPKATAREDADRDSKVEDIKNVILDALVSATKSEVQTMLNPLIDNLGVMLQARNTPRMLESVLNSFNSQLQLDVTDNDENGVAVTAEPPNEGSNNVVDLLTDKLELKKTKSVQKVRAFTKRLRGESTTTMAMAKSINNKNTRKTSSTKNLNTNGATTMSGCVLLPPPPPHCTPRAEALSDDVTSRSSVQRNSTEEVGDRKFNYEPNIQYTFVQSSASDENDKDDGNEKGCLDVGSYNDAVSENGENEKDGQTEKNIPKLLISREPSSLCSSNEEFESARLKFSSPSKKSQSTRSRETTKSSNKSSNSTRSKETTKSDGANSLQSTKESPGYTLQLSEQNYESPRDLNDIFRDRLNYLEQISESPLYVNNSKFPQPWKIVTKIQDNILREMIQRTQNDLSIFMKDENYVKEFLQNEMS